MNLSGKTALVTGSAHRLGRVLAMALADRGCDLVVHFHKARSEVGATLEAIGTLGVRAVPVQADLSKVEGVHHLFQEIDQHFGGLDLLVNSAAVMQRADLALATEEDWDRTIDLNLKAAFFCLQEAAKRMRTRGGGAIVNISDIAGLQPWPQFAIHSISKAGIEMLTRVAAVALAPEIRVNAVAPGPVLKPDRMSEARWQEISQAVPLRRSGTPQDIAQAVVFLLENDFITGETLVVDGGSQLI